MRIECWFALGYAVCTNGLLFVFKQTSKWHLFSTFAKNAAPFVQSMNEWTTNKAIFRISNELLIRLQLLKITFIQLDGSNQQFDVGIRVCNYCYYSVIVYCVNKTFTLYLYKSVNKNQLTEVVGFFVGLFVEMLQRKIEIRKMQKKKQHESCLEIRLRVRSSFNGCN